jgi:hypothetical protein
MLAYMGENLKPLRNIENKIEMTYKLFVFSILISIPVALLTFDQFENEFWYSRNEFGEIYINHHALSLGLMITGTICSVLFFGINSDFFATIFLGGAIGFILGVLPAMVILNFFDNTTPKNELFIGIGCGIAGMCYFARYAQKDKFQS